MHIPISERFRGLLKSDLQLRTDLHHIYNKCITLSIDHTVIVDFPVFGSRKR